MKVICIETPNLKCFKHKVREGKIYTATQCPVFEHNYDIAECPYTDDLEPCSFGKYYFIPLSKIDETTFERNYNTQLI